MTASLYQPAYDGVGGLTETDEADPITGHRSSLQAAAKFSNVTRYFDMRILQNAQAFKQLNDIEVVRHRVPTINDASRQCIAKTRAHFLALKRGEK